jgi:predicted nucleic-acid-binding Zn-ribbon protein
MSFFDAVRASFRGSGKGGVPQPYAAGGRKITCPHCSNDRFTRRKAMLNTRLATFFELDWVNRSSIALVCSNCSMIQWFGESPEPVVTA